MGDLFKEGVTVSKTITKSPSANVSSGAERIIAKITNTWNKAAKYIIDVSKILRDLQDGDQKIWSEVRDTLIERKIMSRTTISNLISIGKKELLTQNVEKLPPAYNTLWVLSTLDDKELQSKLDDGLLTPELRLEDARKWKQPEEFPTVVIEEDESDKKKSIVISIPDEYVIHNYEQIDQDLMRIKMMMKYASVDPVGTLKKKLAGD